VSQRVILSGRADPLGAQATPEGVNFALFSAHAERVDLCLFGPEGIETRLALPERAGDVWHGFVPGLRPGAAYGYRVHGPWAPEIGHRFNPAKLLIDPYARALDAPLRWHAAMQGSDGAAADRVDSAPHCPKALVVAAEPAPTWQRPAHPWDDSVIYEAHVKGLTAAHPEVPRDLRGRFTGLASDPVLRHLNRLGVTAIELLPVQAFLDDRFVLERGLSNYWGYQPIGFFAPDPRYGTAEAFRAMVRRFHAAGIEVILDVVYNHVGRGRRAWGRRWPFEGSTTPATIGWPKAGAAMSTIPEPAIR